MNVSRNTLIAIDQVMHSIDSTLRKAGYTRIYPSHLGAFLAIPKLSTLDFSFHDEPAKVGTLSVSASEHLVHAARHLGGVFAVTSSFRGDADPTPSDGITRGSKWLYETHLIQAVAPGSISDAKKLHHALVRNAVDAISEAGLLSDEQRERLGRVQQPFPEYPFTEIKAKLGGDANADFTLDERTKICNLAGDQPVFVTDFPIAVEPRYTMLNVHRPGGVLSKYDLVLPFGTESGAGGAYEQRREVLQEQVATSTYTREVLDTGGSTDDLQSMAEDLASMEKQHFWLNVGFERFLQFLLGEDDIDRTALAAASARTMAPFWQK
jgi:aspartyl/asparaginyl-tRNA synthetase